MCVPSYVNDENVAPTSVSCATKKRGRELECDGGRRGLECNVTPLLRHPLDTEETEVYKYSYAYTYTYTYAHTHTHTNTYTYTYTHAHAHTHTPYTYF